MKKAKLLFGGKLLFIFNVPTYGLLSFYWGNKHPNDNWGLQWGLCLIPIGRDWWVWGRDEDDLFEPTTVTTWSFGPLGHVRKLNYNMPFATPTTV